MLDADPRCRRSPGRDGDIGDYGLISEEDMYEHRISTPLKHHKIRISFIDPQRVDSGIAAAQV